MPPRVERVLQKPEHGGAALEHLEEALAGLELGAGRVAEQARRTADIQLGRARHDIREHGP